MGTFSKELIVQIIFLTIIIGCASQLPPGGGDVDRIPPEIVEVYPLNGTTNYDDNYFEIEFSEYIDKRTFNDALFISPIVEGRLQFEWTGTSISVEFVEGLKKDITYTITIGTDVVDLNNKNRMVSSYSFSFSTGNTIDRREVVGRVAQQESEGVLIFAYKIDEDVDTLLKRKPDYVSQTSSDGRFHLNGMGESKYRLFAVKDEFRDLIYDMNQDLIGVPNKDISLVGSDSLFVGMKFKLFKADTTAPRLLKGIMTDEKHILVTLSEELDKRKVDKDNFYLIDSTSNQTSAIIQAFKRYGKKDEIVLVPEENLNVENTVFLIAKILSDTLGNEHPEDFVSISISDKPDTTAPDIVGTEPSGFNSSIDFINPKLKFYFNDGIENAITQESISFEDTSGINIPFKFDFEDDATLIVYPVEDLNSDKDYIIKIDLNSFADASGNSRDSIYQFKFKTIAGLDFTGITGKLLNVNTGINPVLILQNVNNKNKTYQQKVSGDDFNFEKIEAGKYMLWCYFDADSNYKFNYGWPQPIEYSERFSVYTDTLKLKERWVITDIIFDLE
ncbi:MAG: Ig-like domain-containing protein [Ignavibacterium sp.]|nr:MAG: Ig-like domain-containing protein [Ignavibacterium sp.]